jgi:2-polyprenyl-3-methyl-5-hydroxy-6-metoxy-1,4-benzoquinol methylase
MPHIKITPEVAETLRRSTINENILTLPADLPRPLYEAVNAVIENAGGKWKRGKGHRFEPGGIASLMASLDSGESRDRIKDRQAFYTPDVIASDIAMFGCVDGKTVLEPSCGGGSLIRAAIHHGAARVVGLELDEPTADATRLAVQSSHPDFPVSIQCADFLTQDTTFLGQFDTVLMNPPFSKDQDLAHIMHAWQFVKPGGILVALTSPGWTFSTRGPRGKFAEWLKNMSDGDTLHEQLPDAQFGRTTIQVVRLVINKPRETAVQSSLGRLRKICKPS